MNRKNIFDTLPLPEEHVWWERPIYSGCPFCKEYGMYNAGDICECGAITKNVGWMMKAVTKEWAKGRIESWA